MFDVNLLILFALASVFVSVTDFSRKKSKHRNVPGTRPESGEKASDEGSDEGPISVVLRYLHRTLPTIEIVPPLKWGTILIASKPLHRP